MQVWQQRGNLDCGIAMNTVRCDLLDRLAVDRLNLRFYQFGHHLLNEFPFSSTQADIDTNFKHILSAKKPALDGLLTKQSREVLALQLEM